MFSREAVQVDKKHSFSDKHKLQREGFPLYAFALLMMRHLRLYLVFLSFSFEMFWKNHGMGVFSVIEREFVVVVSDFEIVFCHADVSVLFFFAA